MAKSESASRQTQENAQDDLPNDDSTAVDDAHVDNDVEQRVPFAVSLDKVRAAKNSKLPNQKMPATVLAAVDQTIVETNYGDVDKPVAYFAALLTLFEQQGQQPSAETTDLRAAILYLFNVVFPYLPTPLLRTKFATTATTLASVLESDRELAPSVRSIIGCLEYALIAQDVNNWATPLAAKLLQTLLHLCVDPRPKVRKRAQDAVRRILFSPPPPARRHPASQIAADFCLRILREVAKNKAQTALHTLAIVRILVEQWPDKSIGPLCEQLLRLPKLNNAYLTVSAFTVFETMLGKNASSFDTGRIEELLLALSDMKPVQTDIQLTVPWLDIVTKGYTAYAQVNPEKCSVAFPDVFTMVFPGLQSSSQQIVEASAKCLATLLPICVTDAMVLQAVTSHEQLRGSATQKKKHNRTSLEMIVAACEQGLGFRFKHGWSGVLHVLRALFARLQGLSTPLLGKTVSMLDDLRQDLQDEDAEIKLDIDATLAAAARVLKPSAFLKLLPLNLDREKDTKSRGRAYLLPLLRDAHLSDCELAYFANALVPLADSLRAKAVVCTNENRVIQAKVYETLSQQIWALFPGFCDLPIDVSAAMTSSFAERTASELYNSPTLRPVVCQGLQVLIEKAQAVVRDGVAAEEEISRRQSDLEHMAKLATNMLSVLFNVFSQTPANSRGYIMEVIRAFLSIASVKDISGTFKKVAALLADGIANPAKPSNDVTLPPPPVHTMLDLSLLMIPYLDVPLATSLFNLAVPLLASGAAADDPTLQKKAYKTLRAIGNVESLKFGVLQANIAELQKKLIEGSEMTTASAKKDRLFFLIQAVSLIPASDLSFIPSVLSEAVVSTKEVNERARNIAYDLLVAMGYRMNSGGVIIQSNIDSMSDECDDGQQSDAQTVPATIDEYFTMVTAGLAGSTAHMISAAITALSRLLFEFKDLLRKPIIDQLVTTVHLFVMGNNREIVRAALGFVKVITVSLPVETLQPHLPDLITGILAWSHEHKSHFKAKVRHIFERLIRRFSYDVVERHVPEEHRKLVINIRKRKERSKRKKNAAVDDGPGNQVQATEKKRRAPRVISGDAFEDALYGSESEIEDTDNEDEEMLLASPKSAKEKKAAKHKKGKESRQWIKEDEDGPLDFLDRKVASRVTSSNPATRRQRDHKDLSSAFASSGDGRLVFAESESDEETTTATLAGRATTEDAEDHYRDTVTSKDGFTRTPQNRIKFNNRKRDRNDGGEPMDIDQPPAGTTERKKQRKGGKRNGERIGQTYKAKNAEGDVKRKNMPEPYAYVPLNPKNLKKRGSRSARPIVVNNRRK